MTPFVDKRYSIPPASLTCFAILQYYCISDALYWLVFKIKRRHLTVLVASGPTTALQPQARRYLHWTYVYTPRKCAWGHETLCTLKRVCIDTSVGHLLDSCLVAFCCGSLDANTREVNASLYFCYSLAVYKVMLLFSKHTKLECFLCKYTLF